MPVVNGNVVRGSNSTIFILLHFSIRGQLLKKEFAPQEQILSFKSRSLSEEFQDPGKKKTGSHKCCLPLKNGNIPIILIIYSTLNLQIF